MVICNVNPSVFFELVSSLNTVLVGLPRLSWLALTEAKSLLKKTAVFFLLKKSDLRSSFFSLEKMLFSKKLEVAAGLASKKE